MFLTNMIFLLKNTQKKIIFTLVRHVASSGVVGDRGVREGGLGNALNLALERADNGHLRLQNGSERQGGSHHWGNFGHRARGCHSAGEKRSQAHFR